MGYQQLAPAIPVGVSTVQRMHRLVWLSRAILSLTLPVAVAQLSTALSRYAPATVAVLPARIQHGWSSLLKIAALQLILITVAN
jgi:hypothetical protein